MDGWYPVYGWVADGGYFPMPPGWSPRKWLDCLPSGSSAVCCWYVLGRGSELAALILPRTVCAAAAVITGRACWSCCLITYSWALCNAISGLCDSPLSWEVISECIALWCWSAIGGCASIAERCFWKSAELNVGEFPGSSLMGTGTVSQGNFPILKSVRFFSQSYAALADRRECQ